jgi:3-oxoacyl-[acyl-carrier protein] reductase
VTLTTSTGRAAEPAVSGRGAACGRRRTHTEKRLSAVRPAPEDGVMTHASPARPARSRVALVTGVGRRRSIGSELALGLAADGWDLALGHWQPYDERLGYERGSDDPSAVADECRALGSRVELLPGDLADPATPERLVAAASDRLGPVTGLVLSHCESVDSSILTTTLESWDRHYAVNARATWLLIRALAERLPVRVPGGPAAAHVVALTSDHTAGNLPYGSSKGALDRIVIAAAIELADRGLRANVVNPGPIDTGWMDDRVRELGVAQTPAGRLGTPQDTADLVRFLLSDRGGWINGQLLHSNGGFTTP